MAQDKSDKQLIVLKVGTSTLTRETNQISRGKLEDIGRQILQLKDRYDFILVCSGAIAVAKQFVSLDGGQQIDVKQALAAIGQPHLMRIIQESFRELNLLTAQCLLSYMDFENGGTRDNIINTMRVLLNNGYIPVVNENDTVSTAEIQFGDNDKLAALTASLIQADLLVLATNTYGIYDSDGATVELIDDVDAAKNHVIKEAKSAHGTGGMSSKLAAAQIAQEAGIETWLVNGKDEHFLLDALTSKVKLTKIRAAT